MIPGDTTTDSVFVRFERVLYVARIVPDSSLYGAWEVGVTGAGSNALFQASERTIFPFVPFASVSECLISYVENLC